MMLRSFVAVLIFLCGAGNVAAQAPGVDFTFSPKIGFYTPLGDLSEGSGTSSKLSSGLALGLAAELDIMALPIALRANLDLAVNSALRIGGAESSTQADVLNLVGDIVFKPFPRILIVQPFVLAGAGMKRYSFNDDQLGFSDTRSTFTGHVGGGVVLDFGPMKFSAELSDYISSYESSATQSKLQHDVFGMLAVRISLL